MKQYEIENVFEKYFHFHRRILEMNDQMNLDVETTNERLEEADDYLDRNPVNLRPNHGLPEVIGKRENENFFEKNFHSHL